MVGEHAVIVDCEKPPFIMLLNECIVVLGQARRNPVRIGKTIIFLVEHLIAVELDPEFVIISLEIMFEKSGTPCRTGLVMVDAAAVIIVYHRFGAVQMRLGGDVAARIMPVPIIPGKPGVVHCRAPFRSQRRKLRLGARNGSPVFIEIIRLVR